MPEKHAAKSTRGQKEKQSSYEGSAVERKRRYKREFMRRWRANPDHRMRESLMRRKWNYDRKKRDASQLPPEINTRGNMKCAICGMLPPVTEVVRLRVSQTAPGGYVEVRLPYCGHC